MNRKRIKDVALQSLIAVVLVMIFVSLLVPSTITSEIGSFVVDGDVSGKEPTYEKSL